MVLISHATANITAEIMRHETLKEVIVTSVTNAANVVMQEDGVRKAWMDVIKKSVNDVVNDPSFMSLITDAIRSSLQDATLYRAAAGGLMDAMNPFDKGRRQEESNALGATT